MGWFSKKKSHKASILTDIGQFVFSHEYGGWTAISMDDEQPTLHFGNDDFDLSALAPLRQLLEDLTQSSDAALRYIRSEANGFGEMEIESAPSAIDFTAILDDGQFGLEFGVREWPDFGVTVEFRGGKPYEAWGGD